MTENTFIQSEQALLAELFEILCQHPANQEEMHELALAYVDIDAFFEKVGDHSDVRCLGPTVSEDPEDWPVWALERSLPYRALADKADELYEQLENSLLNDGIALPDPLGNFQAFDQYDAWINRHLAPYGLQMLFMDITRGDDLCITVIRQKDMARAIEIARHFGLKFQDRWALGAPQGMEPPTVSDQEVSPVASIRAASEVETSEPDNFHLRRRQQFLYKKMYENIRGNQLKSVDVLRSNVVEVASSTEYHIGSLVSSQGFVYHESFWLWMLDYTAGEELDELAPRLSDVVDEFIEWSRANLLYNQHLQDKDPSDPIDLKAGPVFFSQQVWYQDLLQLVSVAIILRDSRSVRRIIAAMPSNRNLDGLYEQLILDYVEDPIESLNETVNGAPYDDLLEAFLEEDDAIAIEWVKQYLQQWYKARREARWYDAHLKIENDLSPYYGYWAFEAGAACYLLGLDDSSIDHMVYPKHLVAYGRQLREADRWTSTDDEPLEYGTDARSHCDAGLSCPREGFWFTPAQLGSRRYFKAGEVMPAIQSDDGLTIWQWDQNQDPPTL